MKNTDILTDAIEHSWGKSPKQKAREKEYNAEYYRKNKEKWEQYRKNLHPYYGYRTDYNLSNEQSYAKDMRKHAQDIRKSELDRVRKLGQFANRENVEYSRQLEDHANYYSRLKASEAKAINEMAKLDAQAKKKVEEYTKKEKKQQFKEDVHNKITDIQSSIEVYVTDPIAKATKKVYDAGKNFVENLFKR